MYANNLHNHTGYENYKEAWKYNTYRCAEYKKDIQNKSLYNKIKNTCTHQLIINIMSSTYAKKTSEMDMLLTSKIVYMTDRA